jgi:RimJ/RimL family protein N-acetyltransferase
VAAVVAANPHKARTLFAEVFQDNPGSARVLTNCGFDYLGDAEAFSVARNTMVPTWTYVKKIA